MSAKSIGTSEKVTCLHAVTLPEARPVAQHCCPICHTDGAKEAERRGPKENTGIRRQMTCRLAVSYVAMHAASLIHER